MATTIYAITGGGQRVRQAAETNQSIEYRKIENSDWPEKAKCEGQDSFTHAMRSTDFENLQRWANDWAGKQVTLVENAHEE